MRTTRDSGRGRIARGGRSWEILRWPVQRALLRHADDTAKCRSSPTNRLAAILGGGYGNAVERARSLVGGSLPTPASRHGDGTIRARGTIGGTRAEREDQLVRFLVR